MKRYATAMLILAAAAALVSTTQSAPATGARAAVQAQAIVRIVTGVTVRLGQGPLVGDGPRAKLTEARADGSSRPAKLIEFQ